MHPKPTWNTNERIINFVVFFRMTMCIGRQMAQVSALAGWGCTSALADSRHLRCSGDAERHGYYDELFESHCVVRYAFSEMHEIVECEIIYGQQRPTRSYVDLSVVTYLDGMTKYFANHQTKNGPFAN